MSGYSRYSGGKGYRRRYSGRPYYGRGWGSTYGKAVGSARASKAGNKLSYYNAQVSGYVTFTFAEGAFTSNIQTFCPFTCQSTMTGSGSTAKYALTEQQYAHGPAIWDKGFRLMCAMNQECRLCRMTVKLQPATTLPTGVACRLASIVDKNLTQREYMNMVAEDTDFMDDAFTAQSVLDNPGAVVQTFNANRVGSLNRYITPTDAKERQSWMDCSVRYSEAGSPLSEMELDGWVAGQSSFAPAFTYVCQTSLAANATTTITFGYTVEYAFAFRNPKSGLDFFIKQEQIGYNKDAKSDTKAMADTTKEKKELEELAATLSSTDPPEEEEMSKP